MFGGFEDERGEVAYSFSAEAELCEQGRRPAVRSYIALA